MGRPDKFLPPEWKHANQVHFRSSEAERSLSQRLTAECQRLIEESDKSTKHMQQDAQKKLGMQYTKHMWQDAKMVNGLALEVQEDRKFKMILDLLKISDRNIT